VNEAALAIFHRNSRYPAQSEGDMSALMASVRLGTQRMEEIAGRFGADVLSDALAQLLDRTRRLVRRRLAETFDYGTHRFTDAIDSDGHGNGPFKLRFAITRERTPGGEDRFIFDATETDDQAPGPVNLLMNRSIPGMALGLFYLGGDPGQVCNAGGPLAIDEVRLREGSLVQPRWPAPLGMRGLTMMRVLATLNGLVNAAGGQAPAAQAAYVVALIRGSWTDDAGQSHPFLLADGIGVGYGARAFADGIDAVYFVAQENYPVEFTELGYPIRFRTYGMVCDSGGPGRFRGGAGILREYEVLADTAMLAIRIDGVQNPPWGIAGGKSGRTGRIVLNPGTAERARTAAALRRHDAEEGRRGADRDRRRRRPRPPVRPRPRPCARGRVERPRQPRGRRRRLWRGDPGPRGGCGRNRPPARRPPGREGLPPQGISRCARLIPSR
jgi:N-methylhydantoinase B